MPLLADVKLKGAPSSKSKEHLPLGEDLLDWVSISNFPIPYSPEIEATLPKPVLGNNMEIEKEIVQAISWAEKVVVDVVDTEAMTASVGYSRAPTVVLGAGAPSPNIHTTPAMASAEGGAGVGAAEGREALLASVCVDAPFTSTNTISVLTSMGAKIEEVLTRPEVGSEASAREGVEALTPPMLEHDIAS